jgi:hypothetical protein
MKRKIDSYALGGTPEGEDEIKKAANKVKADSTNNVGATKQHLNLKKTQKNQATKLSIDNNIIYSSDVGEYNGKPAFYKKSNSKARPSMASGGKVPRQKAFAGALIGAGLGSIGGMIQSSQTLKGERNKVDTQIADTTAENDVLLHGFATSNKVESAILNDKTGIAASSDPRYLGAQVQVGNDTTELSDYKKRLDKGIFGSEMIGATMSSMLGMGQAGAVLGDVTERGIDKYKARPTKMKDGGRALLEDKYYEDRAEGGIVGGDDPTGKQDEELGEVAPGSVIIPVEYKAQAMDWRREFFPDTVNQMAKI